MKEFSEAEIQLLIALIEVSHPIETPNNIGYTFYPESLEQAAAYFRKWRVDWSEAYESLLARRLLVKPGPGASLTPAGESYAQSLRRLRPPIYYWYRDFYTAITHSQAHASFCERVFGKNLGQDGFMDMPQLEKLLEVLHLRPGERVLDLGCGNGLIAELISDLTQSRVTGLDYIPEAIQQAQERTRSRRERLDFQVGNLDCLDFPENSFEALISIDTLYMPNDLQETIRQMKAILKPGGRMGIFFSHALWQDPASTRHALRPENTSLGVALRQNGLEFETWDFTRQDYEHALRKRQAAEALRAAFEAEGNTFLYEIKAAEARGVAQAIEAGRAVRYLYRAVKQA